MTKTLAYIDASNIRNACARIGIHIDFVNLSTYLKSKYKDITDVKLFEGIAYGDTDKENEHTAFRQNGITVFSLSRKSYHHKPIYRAISCPNCSHKHTIEAMSANKKMKSNIDVFLASEFMTDAYAAKEPTHMLLFSCDGDFAEMIKKCLMNTNISISVYATPYVKNGNNYLSQRLKQLDKKPNYHIVNIDSVRDKIKK